MNTFHGLMSTSATSTNAAINPLLHKGRLPCTPIHARPLKVTVCLLDLRLLVRVDQNSIIRLVNAHRATSGPASALAAMLTLKTASSSLQGLYGTICKLASRLSRRAK